ncbi:TPA: hypothetical protein ACH3X2_001266 [Trebouxia sp. C0005]
MTTLLIPPGGKQQAAGLARQLGQLASSRKGAAFAAAIVLAGGGFAYVQELQKQQKRARQRNSKPDGGNSKGARKRRGSPAALQNLVKFLLSIAGKRILVLFALSIARTALSNRLARLQGHLFRAAFLRHVPLFIRNLSENVVLCLAAAAVESTAKTMLAHMELRWRRLLTSRMHSPYFENMTYYKLSYVDKQVQNPEQRICEDIPKFTKGLAELTGEWTNAIIDAGFYAYQLRAYSKSNKYTAAILAYVIGAGGLTGILAPNFGRLFKRQQEHEGMYRHLQARLRSNAESVAFYGGIEKEGKIVVARFKELLRHHSRLLTKQWQFGMVQDFLLKYLGATAAVVLIIGPFFGNHLRPVDSVLGRAHMLSTMRYHTSVVIYLFAALGTLGSSSRKLMRLSAYADRISDMQSTVKGLASSVGMKREGAIEPTGVIVPSEDAIAFEDAMVVTPADATLVRDLNLSVPAGTNLLVTGPNGSGKSSLFRVLGGLWPLTKGRIHKPGGTTGDGLSHDIFYVPQRPYVTLGTLEEQLIYPLTASEVSAQDAIDVPRLRDLLREVDLEYLVDREEGLGAEVNWGELLSLGEQQRLGMARLFYHKPKFAILDECTSGVTVDMEERFCSKVKELGCTCITISHRPALVAFHDLVLALDGEGGWSIHEGATGSFTEETIPEEGEAVVGNGGVQRSGGQGTANKARTKDAAAVLQGMRAMMRRSASSASNANLEGLLRESSAVREEVIARAPPPDPQRQDIVLPPKASLKPSHLVTTWQRWSSVAQELAGKKTQQQLMQVGTIGVVILLRTLLQDRIASLNGRTVQLVIRQDRPGFIRLIGISVLQSAASAVLAPSLRQVADALAMTWRRRLTTAAHARYFKGNTFYTTSQLAGMQDVDQRLTRDVDRLCTDLAELIPTMVKPVVDITWFSWQLWRLTGRRGMAFLYLYSLLGFACLKLVTPDFGLLANTEYRLEGAFRNVHTRLRTHAESIAFFGGGPREGRTVAAYFDRLTEHLLHVANIKWLHSVADDFFTKQLPFNVTWVLTLMYAVDQGEVANDPVAQGLLVHNMRYLASVVSNCFTAFGELLALNKRFAELSGGVTRVSEMLEVMSKSERLQRCGSLKRTPSSPRSPTSPSQGIQFDKVTVIAPSGKVLARELSFQVSPGSSILVTGPNGSGKSSLFRLLGGLWPLTDGQIRKPGGNSGALLSSDIFYVPQKPYTTIGTLREQVIYPLSTADAVAKEGLGEELTESSRKALETRLDELMESVRLSYLVTREGGWDANTEWGETLSLGEQQRIGMARLFFHKPKFGVLDECTNATSVDVEEHLYQYAAQLGITLVTITQRLALVKYHDAELRLLDGEGDWELRQIVK